MQEEWKIPHANQKSKYRKIPAMFFKKKIKIFTAIPCFMLLISCGLDAPYEPLDPPILDVSSTGLLAFKHNTANDVPGRAFNGYDVFYKYYGISSTGDTEYSIDKNDLLSSNLNPQSALSKFELERRGFFHVFDKDKGEQTPLISIESSLGSSFVYAFDFFYSPGKNDAVILHNNVVSQIIKRKNGKSFFMVSAIDATENNSNGDIFAPSAKTDLRQPGGTVQLNLALVIFAYGFDLSRINTGGTNIDDRSRPIVTDRVKVSINN